MPPYDRTSSASRATHERRDKLLSQARAISREQGFVHVGNLLVGKLDMDILEDILNDLDASQLRIRDSLPPNAPLPPEVGDNEKDGHDGLMDLSTVLYGLYRAYRAENHARLRTLMDACIEKVHLRWADIAKWIMLCAEKISPADFIPGHWNRVMHYCDRILEPILFESDKNHFKLEILTADATIDIIFCFLRIVDPRTQRPARLEPSPGSRCTIARIFSMYLSMGPLSSLASRLESLPAQTKQEVVQSIILRIADLRSTPRESPEDIDEINADIVNLIPKTCYLVRKMGAVGEFAHRDVLFEGVRTLSTILDDCAAKDLPKPDSITIDHTINQLVSLATWQSVAYRAMEGLFEGGIIPCILRALLYTDRSHPDSEGLKGPAWKLLPYLTDTRIYQSAKKGGGTLELMKELDAMPKTKAIEAIYNAYSLALRCCKAAFADDRKPVQMCYSTKHQLPDDNSAAPTDLKTCSTCHAAYYCSRACQKEDWGSFHSVECQRALHRWRKNLKDAGMTERIEHEKLMFLEVLANRFLPPLPALVARDNADGQGETKVHVFDLAGKLFRGDKPPKFVDYSSMTLPVYFKKYEGVIGDRTQARLGKCAEDVKAEPESAVLVAGTFQGRQMVICICAKMLYNPVAEVGERYRAATHACSLWTLPGTLRGVV